jgi:hypothetical protein
VPTVKPTKFSAYSKTFRATFPELHNGSACAFEPARRRATDRGPTAANLAHIDALIHPCRIVVFCEPLQHKPVQDLFERSPLSNRDGKAHAKRPMAGCGIRLLPTARCCLGVPRMHPIFHQVDVIGIDDFKAWKKQLVYSVFICGRYELTRSISVS